MNILQKLFKREERTEEPEKIDLATLLEPALSNNNISNASLSRIPSVVSSVEEIANMVAVLPLKLYKREYLDSGEVVLNEITNDYRLNLLNISTGDVLNPFEMKKAIVKDYFLKKGGYIYIEKKRNKIKSLRYINPDYIGFDYNNDPIYKDGILRISGQTYERFNFILLLRNSKNGLTGTPILEDIKEILETSYKTNIFENGLVSKGGAKKGFIKTTKKIDAEGMDTLKRGFKNFYKNGDNLIVLNDGLQFQEAGNSSVELQLEERKKRLNTEIKEAFNLEGDSTEIIRKAVIPVISLLENSINEVLLLEKEKNNLYFAFDTNKITRGSIKERFEAYKIALDGGWLTTNEVREAEDYKTIEGLDVINMSLGSVLYDTKLNKYFTPNMGEISNLTQGGEVNEDREEKQ